jgi:CrcB protein
MNQMILVFVGGGLGSLARYGVGKAFVKWSSVFPFGTLTANILACLVMGFFTGWAALKPTDINGYRAFIAVGFCGGFSTFSTFSNETILLIQNNRFGDATLNIFLSLMLCFGATLGGMWLGKNLLS